MLDFGPQVRSDGIRFWLEVIAMLCCISEETRF